MEAREPVKLLLGGGGSGKTAAALGEYRRVLQRAPYAGRRRALWLAPTFGAAADVREALVARGDDAFLDPGVVTFAEFAEEAVRDSRRRVRPISSLQRRRLLGRVIDEAVDEGALAYFGPVARSPGFLALVEDWIADRKRGAAPGDEAPIRSDATVESRTRDLIHLHARYEARLTAGNLCDLEGVLWLACDALRNAPALPDGLELVVADGFADFTAAEHAVLRVLRGRTEQMWITLVGEGAECGMLNAEWGRNELWTKTVATMRRLERDGPVEIVPMGVEDASTWPAMRHVERNLFRGFHQIEAPSAEAIATAARLSIVAASSVQAEIEEIARRVKQLLVGGERPGDIVVAFRSTRDVAERLRQALEDFGVPFWLDAPRRLAPTPLARSLVGVLRLAADDWPYRRVLQAAGDSSLDALGAAHVRTAIERCVREAQLPSDREALLSQIAAWAAASRDEKVPNVDQAALAAGALGRLAAALDALPKRASLAAWVAALQLFAEELGLLGDRSSADAPATWSSLVRGLHEIDSVDGWTVGAVTQLSVAEFIEVLLATAEYLPAPQGHDAAGCVAVLSAEAARFARPKHLFLGGLSEQAFAAGRGAELDDPAAKPAGEQRRDTAADEMLLFYQVITRARETLTLSYPALDGKAQPLAPSPLLAELERCLAGAPISRTVQSLGYAAEEVATVLSRSDLRRAAVGQALEGRRELLAALVRENSPILDGIEIVASRAQREGFEAFEGVLASEAVRRWLETHYGADHLWSPSQLELYATCPFRFFGEQALHLQPAPDLALADDLARRGHLLHDTLARLYARRAAAADGGAEEAGEFVVQFNAALDEATRARPGRGLNAALREIERRQIAAWAGQVAEQDEAYQAAWAHLDAPPVPAHFEARFGPVSRRRDRSADAAASTDKPFELVVPIAGREERVGFTGQIDRIDVGRAGGQVVFNVIDYKTSARAVVDEAKVYAGTQLQLPLYAMATADLLLSQENAAALSAGYWSVRGKGFGVGQRTGRPLAINEVRDGAVLPARGWETMRTAIVGTLGEIITGIRRGWFPVFNDDKQCTTFCSLRTVCRIAHVRSLEKEWAPPTEAP